LSVTANQAIRCAVSGNARHFYTGRTTAEQFEFCGTATEVAYKTVQRLAATFAALMRRDAD
jgi:hypothetical protein